MLCHGHTACTYELQGILPPGGKGSERCANTGTRGMQPDGRKAEQCLSLAVAVVSLAWPPSAQDSAKTRPGHS